jgi:hypothetical protein
MSENGHLIFKRYRAAGRTPEQRFWAFVVRDPDTECWLWCGAQNRKGYGAFRALKRNIESHRFAWRLTQGPIPDGLWVLHRCDVPACVNPAHLFLGTPADNTADMMRKGRHRPHPSRGERHGMARLTDAQVQEIRAARVAGVATRVLAQRFGVAHRSVQAIVRRENWRHLP